MDILRNDYVAKIAAKSWNTLCDYVMGQCAAMDGRGRNNIHGRDTIFATTRDIVLGNT